MLLSPNKPSALSRILKKFPCFSFALDEYILSLKHAGEIALKWDAFRMLDTGEVGSDYVRRQWTASAAAPAEHINIWRKTTSGTTDDVKTITYSESFYFQQLFLPIRRFFHHACVAPDSESVVLSINNSGRSSNWLFKDPVGWFGAIALLNIDERNLSSVIDALEIATALRPTGIISTPPLLELFSELGTLERLADTAFVISSGAELDVALKKRIERTVGCPVLNCYALSETSVIAVECTHGQGLHIDSLWADVHIEGGMGKKEEIIIDNCSNDAMPVNEFRTGDFAEWSENPCRCGSHTPRLVHLEGKRLPLFYLPDGVFLDPGRLNRILPPILGTYRFMVQQTTPTEFTIAMPTDSFRSASTSIDVRKALNVIFPESCRLKYIPMQNFCKRTKFLSSLQMNTR